MPIFNILTFFNHGLDNSPLRLQPRLSNPVPLQLGLYALPPTVLVLTFACTAFISGFLVEKPSIQSYCLERGYFGKFGRVDCRLLLEWEDFWYCLKNSRGALEENKLPGAAGPTRRSKTELRQRHPLDFMVQHLR
jgi:hypothetical protein